MHIAFACKICVDFYLDYCENNNYTEMRNFEIQKRLKDLNKVTI